jgi:hypothetical protein
VKSKGCALTLAVVRDLREQRVPASDEELADFETDVLAGFVLARASAGIADSTIRNDTNHLELIRDWFGRPLWEIQPADADAYFDKVLRNAKPSTRTRASGRADGVLPVPGAATQGRAAQPDRSGGRLSAGRAEPATCLGRPAAAYPTDRRRYLAAVRRQFAVTSQHPARLWLT